MTSGGDFKSLRRMMRRLGERSGLVFGLVFAWKVALLVFTTQPVPANDSFFYDGPVVNLLLHGKYVNPSIALGMPTSANEVFCAYPPLYQLVLLGWMGIFGTSALAAMWLHVVLFGACLWLVLATLRRVNTPIWCLHVAGAFFFVITFHDRPDTLAHTFGLLAVYAWVRSKRILVAGDTQTGGRGWLWAMAGFAILCFGTSPLIGALYLLLLFVAVAGAAMLEGERIPLLPVAVMIVAPPLAIAGVAFAWPHLWAGFIEHARQTPSLTGLRVPPLAEMLKVLRTVPGILAVAVLTPVLYFRTRPSAETRTASIRPLGLAALLAAGAVVFGSMFFLTANVVHVASYLQPLIVGCFLTFFAATRKSSPTKTIHIWLFTLLALFGSIRAIGISTWGVACARDVSYAKARELVSRELTGGAAIGPVVVSGPFLYESAQHAEVRAFHSDWLGPIRRGEPFSFADALVAVKPGKMILSQLDYYRRYEPVLAELKGRPELADIQIRNTASTRTPDSIPSMQRIVQHISWAPVIVTLTWKEARP